MAQKKIICKVFYNKRTNQPVIFPSKKKIKAVNPTLKFNDDLFVSIRFLKNKPNKKING